MKSPLNSVAFQAFSPANSLCTQLFRDTLSMCHSKQPPFPTHLVHLNCISGPLSGGLPSPFHPAEVLTVTLTTCSHNPLTGFIRALPIRENSE